MQRVSILLRNYISWVMHRSAEVINVSFNQSINLSVNQFITVKV